MTAWERKRSARFHGCAHICEWQVFVCLFAVLVLEIIGSWPSRAILELVWLNVSHCCYCVHKEKRQQLENTAILMSSSSRSSKLSCSNLRKVCVGLDVH